MRSRNAAIVCFVAAFVSCGKKTIQSAGGYDVPAGFTVEEAAPGAKLGSLISMTFDSLGRPVVAKQKSGAVILLDNDNDGVYESEKIFSDKIFHAQGMWFDGRVLYATGNDSEGQVGLYRMEDTNGDDVADTFERVSILNLRSGEHGPHDIRRGPDGEPTIMLGNHTGVPKEVTDAASPLSNYGEGQLLERYWDARGHAKDIYAPGGTLVRFNRDAKNFTVLFGGMRNAYNHAYNREGEAFAFDSDMEWDINMPWYRQVRSIHGVPGADYGWRSGSGKFPDYFIDSLPPYHEAGRGSPVGVEFYHHYVYPQRYFDSFLEGDWSRGRILISAPRRAGATYAIPNGATEFVHGEPLNVTDLEVGPDGFVYFTTGGRDTQGGFYRIRYTPGFFEKLFRKSAPEGILAAVRQPQPLSSWGHAALLKRKEALGARWATELEELARNPRQAADDRVQAVFLLQRLGPKPSADLLKYLSQDSTPSVRAAAVYLSGIGDTPEHRAIAAGALKDTDAFTRRRAAEALVRQGGAIEPGNLLPLLSDPDRFVRYSARVALERADRARWSAEALRSDSPEALVALTRTAASNADLDPVLARELALLKQPGGAANLGLLRAIQLTAIKYQGGLPEAARKELYSSLAPHFPASSEPLNREYARMMAYTGQPEAIAKILAAMPADDDRTQLQIHYVYCLRSIKSGWTKEQKQKLIGWFPKAAAWRGGASFTGFINFLFDSSLEFMDEDEKKMAYARVPAFAPLKAEESGRTGQPNIFARQRGVQAYSAQEILEFQLFDPMTSRGKAEEGRKVFEEACASCHRFGDVGKDFGPDLTTLSSRFRKKDILESILFPSKTISDQYQSWVFELRDGDVINGLLVSEKGSKLVVKTGDQERPIEIDAKDVKSRRLSTISIMPENVLDGFSMSQISDLMAYLLAAK